ncbi:MAG: hypothetical protein IKQ94_03925 [Bacteroidales bacterium]|nr:hypothetical protein [Bacteroidales bacterium]
MSRFESSRFVRNPQVMHVEVLKSACDTLGWTYSVRGNELLVTNANQGERLYGEYALKLNLTTNEVTYNTYYMHNAVQKVEELQNQFYALNAAYAKKSLIQEFKKKGFTYKSNDHFTPSTEEVFCFFMVGRSKDKNEDEPLAQIKFTILKDGTIVTDSDYLPNDVNERAHEAMDVLEVLLGNKRVMTKKTNIPAKYLAKMKPRRVNIQTIKNK